MLATSLPVSSPLALRVPSVTQPPAEFFGKPAFEVIAPGGHRLPVILNSPHSGCCYPDDFLAASRLDEKAIRRSEDSYVDDLVAPAAACGCASLCNVHGHAHASAWAATAPAADAASFWGVMGCSCWAV